MRPCIIVMMACALLICGCSDESEDFRNIEADAPAPMVYNDSDSNLLFDMPELSWDSYAIRQIMPAVLHACWYNGKYPDSTSELLDRGILPMLYVGPDGPQIYEDYQLVADNEHLGAVAILPAEYDDQGIPCGVYRLVGYVDSFIMPTQSLVIADGGMKYGPYPKRPDDLNYARQYAFWSFITHTLPPYKKRHGGQPPATLEELCESRYVIPRQSVTPTSTTGIQREMDYWEIGVDLELGLMYKKVGYGPVESRHFEAGRNSKPNPVSPVTLISSDMIQSGQLLDEPYVY